MLKEFKIGKKELGIINSKRIKDLVFENCWRNLCIDEDLNAFERVTDAGIAKSHLEHAKKLSTQVSNIQDELLKELV